MITRTSTGAKVLAILGDMITTDHISPAGSFKDTTRPAGEVPDRTPGQAVREFNSYGSRRGNHEVMMRGTFANIRIKNEMLDGCRRRLRYQGPRSGDARPGDLRRRHGLSGCRHRPLVIFGGEQYGAGSSRDWAAKGTSPAWRQGGHRRELRAHPPLEPRRHGRDPVRVHRRRHPQDTGAQGRRNRQHLRSRHVWSRCRRCPARSPMADGTDQGDHTEMPDRYRRLKSSTLRMAACFTTCCAIWPSAA